MSPRQRVVDRVSKRRTRTPEPQKEPRALNGAPVDLRGEMYLTVAEAQQYLKLPSEHSVYKFLRAHPQVGFIRTGRRKGIRISRASIDALQTTEPTLHRNGR